MEKTLATSDISLSNPVIARALPNNLTEQQLSDFKDLLSLVRMRHNLQAQMVFSSMSKLFDRKTTEDTGIGAFYQFGSCIITDLLAGTTKRLYAADLAAQSQMCTISGYVDLGNINLPQGLDYFFMVPGAVVDIKAYELMIKSIDTLKSIPTVQFSTARLYVQWVDGGISVNDIQNSQIKWAKDSWNLESERATTFDFKMTPSFPQRNTSGKLNVAQQTDRIFVSETVETKYNEIFYDSFEAVFTFKGNNDVGYFVTYLLPLAPVDLICDLGVGTPFTFAAADLTNLIIALQAHPVLGQIYSFSDAGGGGLQISAINLTYAPVAAIFTSTTAGTVVQVNPQAVFELGIALDRLHPYSQSQIIMSKSRNFYIKGADASLRIALTPVTDLTNSATNTSLEQLK